MKRVLLLCLCALIACVNGMAQGKSATISGSFFKRGAKNIPMDNIYLYYPNSEDGRFKQMGDYKLDSEHRFVIVVPEKDCGILYLGGPSEVYLLHVKPGEALNIDVFDAKITFHGKLSKQNELLKQWYQLIAEIREIVYVRESMQVAFSEFFPKVEKLAPQVEKFVAKLKTGDKEFDRYMKFTLPFNFNEAAMMIFAGPHPDDEPRAKDFMPHMVSLMKGGVFDSMEYLKWPFMMNYISLYGFVKGGFYYGLMLPSYADYALEAISDPELKAEVILTGQICRTLDQYPAFEKKYFPMMVTEEQKARFLKIRKDLAGLTTGDKAIDFVYPDMNGKHHALSDYKGKVVVVDVWATWCGPCKAEIPYLKKLEEEMKGKDVVFIGVSIDGEKDYDKWKQMIIDGQLAGVQLFAGNPNQISLDYKINGIPHFMVFGKDGKVVSVEAPRPSTPALKAMIEAELKK